MTSGQANFYFIVGLLQHISKVIMNWTALFFAGIVEIGWRFRLKMSQQQGNNKTLWILVAVFSMTISGGLLWYSQKSIPIGTAYAVWTGIGAVGTMAVGIFFFGDSASTLRLIAALLIVIGIVGLKFAN